MTDGGLSNGSSAPLINDLSSGSRVHDEGKKTHFARKTPPRNVIVSCEVLMSTNVPTLMGLPSF